MMVNTWRTAAIALGLMMLGGCQDGPELGTVAGKVSMQGQPIPFAYVVFQPTGPGTYASAYTKGDGSYELQFTESRNGAQIGKHQITIRTAAEDEIQVEDKTTGLMVTPPLPAGYQGRLEFTFDREVASGENVHDFDLDPTQLPPRPKSNEPRRKRVATFP
jgi:hypothetical protein